MQNKIDLFRVIGVSFNNILITEKKLDQFSYVGNRARYEFIELDMSTGLDEQIDLGKPYSICRYRARFVEDGE